MDNQKTSLFLRFIMFLIAFSGILMIGCDDSREVKSAGVLRTTWLNEAVEKLCDKYGKLDLLENTAGIESAIIKRTSVIVDTATGRIVESDGKKYLQGKIISGDSVVAAAFEISKELEEKFRSYHYSQMLSVVQIDSLSEYEKIYTISGYDGDLLVTASPEKYITGKLIDFEEMPPMYHFEYIENQR